MKNWNIKMEELKDINFIEKNWNMKKSYLITRKNEKCYKID